MSEPSAPEEAAEALCWHRQHGTDKEWLAFAANLICKRDRAIRAEERHKTIVEFSGDLVSQFAAVRADERERCAWIAYSAGKEADRANPLWLEACEHIAEIIRKGEERTAAHERHNALKPIVCPACGRVGDPKTIVAQCEHSGTGPTIKCALRGKSEERTS